MIDPWLASIVLWILLETSEKENIKFGLCQQMSRPKEGWKYSRQKCFCMWTRIIIQYPLTLMKWKKSDNVKITFRIYGTIQKSRYERALMTAHQVWAIFFIFTIIISSHRRGCNCFINRDPNFKKNLLWSKED